MWTKIYGFDDYLCNEQGEIYSLKRNRILKGRSLKGYRRVVLMKDGKPIDALVHRLIAQTFIPNPENKPEINHKDGNKENNNISKLDAILSASLTNNIEEAKSIANSQDFEKNKELFLSLWKTCHRRTP